MNENFNNEYEKLEDSDGSFDDWEKDSDDGVPDFTPDNTVELPVGLRKDGQVFRTVVIDELCGIDDHLVASNKSGGNGAKAMSMVLCRAVQEVPGLLRMKKDSEKLFNREFARALTEIDRVFLITRIFMLSGRNESAFVGRCRHCKKVHNERVFLSQLEVKSWPDDKPPQVEFHLKKGFKEKTDSGKEVFHKEGILRFPLGKESELLGKMENEAEATDSLLAACIVSVGNYGKVDTSMVKALKRQDREELMFSLSESLPGIKQGKWITCECGMDMELRLDLISFFEGRRRNAKRP
jgi:hypothetical protein